MALSDKKLIDWLSTRMYVEATNNGHEDTNRFMYHAFADLDFREALSDHIEGKPKKRRPEKTIKIFPR